MNAGQEADAKLPSLGPLAAWADRLAPGAITFATWAGGEAMDDGSFMSMPCPVYHEDVQAFIAEAYDRGWVLSDFDWTDWTRNRAARLYANDPATVESAPAADLFRLLTVALRSERFRDGAFLEVLETGLIDAITRRAATLNR